ncbi:MAG: hypothetical protein ACLQVD_15565 [Capsulimonadaceae bacterium]
MSPWSAFRWPALAIQVRLGVPLELCGCLTALAWNRSDASFQRE